MKKGPLNRCYRLIWNAEWGSFVVAPEYARRRGKGGGRRRKPAMALAAGFALASAVAWAAPTGGTVTTGTATISQTGATTTITQSTQKASINWQGFSVGAKETVNFAQPNASSITLNRVIGNERSVIDGALNANGKVFLINSNGVLFSKGSSVNVGGLVASTLDLSDSDFQAGKYVFKGSSGSVINQGTITAKDGGYVALLGGSVSNQGVITATKGTVALASGEQVTLTFAGDSLASVVVDQGTLDALVENKEAIYADGGTVILSAKAANDLVASQVNNSGIIQARTLDDLKGNITLYAHGGTTTVSGTLDASAPKGGDGGAIETSGDRVSIADSASITTQSSTGKVGTWLIDPTDFTISLGNSAQTDSGIGVDTLEKLLASNAVTIATSASGGEKGDININAALGSITYDSNWSLVTINGLPNALTLTAANDININAVVVWTANTLTLNAGRNININAQMSASGSAGFAATYGTGTNSDGSPVGLYTTRGSIWGCGKITFSSDWTGPTGVGKQVSLNGENYTVLTTADEVEALLGPTLAGNYVLGSAVDISNTTLSSGIGTFTGNLNGFGNNLTVHMVGTGFFDTLAKGATVSNLGIISTIDAAPAGTLTNPGAVGGLANVNYGNILNSSAASGGWSPLYYNNDSTKVSAESAGGLVGINHGLIDQCFGGDVFGSSGFSFAHVGGGLVGTNAADGRILDCQVKGSVGIAQVDGAYVDTVTNIGGVVGVNEGVIERSSFVGWMDAYQTPSTPFGGFVGKNTGTIDQCYTNRAGNAGFAWENTGTITNSYVSDFNYGGVYEGVGETAQHWIAGFVYRNSGTISNAYVYLASGDTLDATRYGFVADNSGGSITHAYWHSNLLSDDTGTPGTTPTDTTPGVTQLDATQALTFSNYKGFDTSAWGATATSLPVLKNITVYLGTQSWLNSQLPYVYGSITDNINLLGLNVGENGLFGQNGVGLSNDYDPTTSQLIKTYTLKTDNGYVDAGSWSASELITSTLYTNIKGVIVVAPKTLTVSGVVAEKTYDGGTSATLNANTGSGTLSGLVGNQTLGVSYGAASFKDKSAGKDKNATVTYTLSNGSNGGKSGNYTLTNSTTNPDGTTSATTTATIDPKTLTATATVADKTYDGRTSATVTGVSLSSGVITGDEVSAALASTSTATFADKNAGTDKTVTVTGIGLSGADAGNYTVASTQATASIAPKSLVLYGTQTTGSATVAGSTLSVTNLVNGDTATLGGSASLASTSTGAQTLGGISGLTVDNPNYTLTAATGTVVVGNANRVLDKVTSGSAGISTSGSTTTVTTSTDKSVLDWYRFSIASGETVAFAQPSTTSLVLNRVVGNEQSVIAGTLSSNGRVFLINSNGILFAAGSSVNVGAMVASSLELSDSNFASGNYVFTARNSGSVVNQGDIVIVEGGFLALAGKGVSNTGTISDPAGSTLLVSADQLTLNLDSSANLASYSLTGLNGTTTLGGAVNLASSTGGGVLETAGSTVTLAEGCMLETGTDGTWSWSLPSLSVGENGTLSPAFVKNNLAIRNLSLNALDGDLTLDGAVSWSANTTLSLGASHDINFNNALTATGDKAGLVMSYGDEYSIRTVASYSGAVLDAKGNPVAQTDTSGGVYGSITLSGANASLKINGDHYTLIHSMSQLDLLDSLDAVSNCYYNVATGKYDIPAFIRKTVVDPWIGARTGNYYYNPDTAAYDLQSPYTSGAYTATGHYALAQNLDASGTAYTNAVLTNLSGTLAGLGHTVSHLNISAPYGGAGLVGSIDGAVIRDIGVTDATILCDSGGILLEGGAWGEISHAYSSGSISGASNVGGLIGGLGSYDGNHPSQVDSCFSSASVFAAGSCPVADPNCTNMAFAGGLIGLTSGVTLSRCHATGDVTGASGGYIGGLVGSSGGWFDDVSSTWVYNLASIDRCYATGKVAGTNTTPNNDDRAVGGLLGEAWGATITNSFATGAVSGNHDVGGLIGSSDFGYDYRDTTVSHCYATGDASGTGSTGGLIGWTQGVVISDSFATGDVSSAGGCGGLVGFAANTDISRCYATGNVTSGGNMVGGLVGDMGNTNISGCYASGNVSGADSVGGLVGGTETGWCYITNSQAYGNVSGANSVGGILGSIVGCEFNFYNTHAANLSGVTSYGNVSASGNYAGGILGSGDLGSAISNAAAYGNVSGANYVGGIAGQVYSLSASDFYGTATGTGYNVGAVAGNATSYVSGNRDMATINREAASQEAGRRAEVAEQAEEATAQQIQDDSGAQEAPAGQTPGGARSRSRARTSGEGSLAEALDQNLVFAESGDFSADVQRIEVDGQTFLLNGDEEEKKPEAKP